MNKPRWVRLPNSPTEAAPKSVTPVGGVEHLGFAWLTLWQAKCARNEVSDAVRR
jgi:hypothetical protein